LAREQRQRDRRQEKEPKKPHSLSISDLHGRPLSTTRLGKD
jgi:hypothetical protein